MSDTLSIIAAICAELNGNGFCSAPRVVERKNFDLSEFTEQESDIPGLTTEFVNQVGGGGMTGDEFHGTMAYPFGEMLFVIDYHC